MPRPPIPLPDEDALRPARGILVGVLVSVVLWVLLVLGLSALSLSP